MPGIFTATESGAIAAPHPDIAARAAIEWQAHFIAGRLPAAAPTAPSPEIAANRARTGAIFARRLRQQQGPY